jgi:hypothetical protein
MKDVDLLEVVPQVLAFVGSQNSQREADQGPQVDHRVATAIVFAKFVDLGVAVVATGDAVVGAGGLDLLILEAAILQALLLETGLEEAAASAAAEIVGTVGGHIDEVLFAHHGFDHEAQVLGDGVTVAFAHDLAGVLNREFDLQLLVPVAVDLELALPDPLGVVLVDVLDFKIMFEVEFFQSGPD